MGALYRWQTKTYLLMFNCLQAERATRQRRPLLQLKTKQLMLPARRWKRSLQLGICKWDAMEALYRRQTKYLFANLEVFTSGEDDEAASPSCVAENEAIGASSSWLEALIATWYMQRGCKWEHFTHGKQKPVCRSLSVYKQRGRRGNVALFCNTLRHN